MAVQDKNLPGLGADHQRRDLAAVRLGKVDQAWLHWQVKVPQVVVNGLVDPLFIASSSVQSQHRSAVLVIQCRTLHTIDIGGRAAHWQEDGIHQRVIRHGRPAVGRAANVGLTVCRSLFVLRVAGVERPAHGAGYHVKTTDHTARHVGLHVIGYPAANHDCGTRHQWRRRQLIKGVGHIAQASFEINLAIGTEVLAELAGVSIHSNQARIDGVGQQATLAGSAGGNGHGHGRGAAISWQGNRGAGIKVSQATATLPDSRLGIDVVLPQLFAGVGIQSDEVVVRGADKHLVAHLQRGHLVFCAIAVADRNVASVVSPGRHQFGNVAAVDLIQCGKAAAAFVIPVVCPVFLRVGRIDLGQARSVTGWGY